MSISVATGSHRFALRRAAFSRPARVSRQGSSPRRHLTLAPHRPDVGRSGPLVDRDLPALDGDDLGARDVADGLTAHSVRGLVARRHGLLALPERRGPSVPGLAVREREDPLEAGELPCAREHLLLDHLRGYVNRVGRTLHLRDPCMHGGLLSLGSSASSLLAAILGGKTLAS